MKGILAFIGILLISGMAEAEVRLIMPVYGNWCGPGHPADISLAGPPVDPLDASCMRHDLCYATNGQDSCGCDIALLRELRGTRWPNPETGSNARAIYDAMALAPCDGIAGMAIKESLFAYDLFNDMRNGNAAPVDVPERWWQLLSER